MRVTGPPGSATPLTLSRGGCSAYKMNSQLISCSGGKKKKNKKEHEFFFKFSSYSKSRSLLTDDADPTGHAASVSRSTLQSPRDPGMVISENGPRFPFLLQRPTCCRPL